MQEQINEIVNTLKKANNEENDSPYWLIIDPRQMMSPDCYAVASMITGPFFSREDATAHLKARRYSFSKRAVVYSHSGYWSHKYKEFYRAIENERQRENSQHPTNGITAPATSAVAQTAETAAS